MRAGLERRLARLEARQSPPADDGGIDWSRFTDDQLRRLLDIGQRAQAEGMTAAEVVEGLTEDEIRDLREMAWEM